MDESVENGFFDEEWRLDKSRGILEGIVGMVGSKIASSTQLKGEERVVAGIRGSGIGIEKGKREPMPCQFGFFFSDPPKSNKILPLPNPNGTEMTFVIL